ncbi:hypothetical protein EKO27_g2863 [Xylaria grammica]|uniref:BZIP transcription factor n=1 Tax=Xylaria grammica TaxID=363999 RepID=A0A439DD03_9PEZI|nr:hypothetical protein EKO27_g2863 [Xylaria grammica]
MLPSTSPSPTSTNRPTPTSTFPPASAATSTEPSLVHRQPTSAGARAGATPTASAAVTPGLGAGPLPNDSSLYKRGPSSSLDGQSPDSSSSLPGLAKKRANDREAQRAIRERTRNQIEALESRIRELTAQEPYLELQKAVQEKEAAEANIVKLKERMASVVALLQPLLSIDTAEVPIHHSTQPTQQLQQLSSYSTQSSSTPGRESTPHSSVDLSWHGQGLAQPGSHLNSGNPSAKTPNQLRHPNLNIGGEYVELDFVLGPSQRLNKMQTGVNGAQDSPAYQHVPMKHDWGPVAHFDRINTTTSSTSSPTQQNQYVEYAPDPSYPPQVSWIGAGAPIKHVPATCPLDHVLLKFMHERRQRAAEGLSPIELVGPRYPSIFSLLNPTEVSHSHPVSKVFTDILSKFSAICKVPEKVAVLYVMFMVMRWHICPTKENFDLLPSFSRPIDIQYSTPHPAWIDYLPFPSMREKFIQQYNDPNFHFDEIFIPYTLTLSLNWPYEDTDALIVTPDDSETIINPVFLTHLSRLENWTLGDAFDQALPALRGTYNLKRGGDALNRKQSSS